MPDPRTIRPLLDDDHLGLAAELDGFVREQIAPLGAPADDAAAREQGRAVLDRLGAGGWAAYAVPAEHGGALRGAGLRACCLVREALAFASPLADAIFALQALGSGPLADGGSDELKREWLPRIARGEVMTAFAMTEPEAGSDVGSIRTRALRDGDSWVLDGRKWLLSNAGIADLYAVFATSDPEAGTRGLSCFLVAADHPGLRFVGPQVLAAPHPLGEIELAGCRVPDAQRLGAPGEGFKLGMRILDRLRATVAAAACGMAARALAEARAHAAERRQFGRALADFQLVQASLADMATGLESARLMTYRAAWEVDRGGSEVTYRSAMAKLQATETAQRVVDAAVQILGGRGVLAAHPVDHLYRSVRALRIYEGPSDIQRLVIARRLPE
ncbi:MAG: acyl-CoA dehydrogenase family protein [Acidobacteriota bacterium]|nr:acyl-CoA dehydrogenase family protein [Acidobacteriota bacterium]MDH3524270.1 acyl-CoA dehydrogenase family protein [Acidobacteriota bacterium]